MIHEAAAWLVDFVHSLGLTGLFIATFLESTFVPIPSAATMIPAGYLVQQGHWNVWIVILIGITGTISGSLANYAVAYYFGRPFLARYGKFMHFGPKRQQQLDSYFAKHGEISIFTARLLPAVRHVISFPAGLAKMNVGKFCLLTGLGGGLWMTTLMMLGYMIGHMGVVMDENNVTAFYEEMSKAYLPYMPYIFLGAIAVAAAIVSVYFVMRSREEKTESSNGIA